MSLEKIANNESLTREDMVKAASEYVELEKQAANAEEIGREAAREDFAKKAEEEKPAEAPAETPKESPEAEKVASAIETLKKYGVK